VGNDILKIDEQIMKLPTEERTLKFLELKSLWLQQEVNREIYNKNITEFRANHHNLYNDIEIE
jgi:dihydroxyacetone kinase DhaKLM complex PTS-EIIA-like component DhaM